MHLLTLRCGALLTDIDAALQTNQTNTNKGDLVIFSPFLVHRQPGHPFVDRMGWSLLWQYQDSSLPPIRAQAGHVVRSQDNMDREVQDGEEWVELRPARLRHV